LNERRGRQGYSVGAETKAASNLLRAVLRKWSLAANPTTEKGNKKLRAYRGGRGVRRKPLGVTLVNPKKIKDRKKQGQEGRFQYEPDGIGGEKLEGKRSEILHLIRGTDL